MCACLCVYFLARRYGVLVGTHWQKQGNDSKQTQILFHTHTHKTYTLNNGVFKCHINSEKKEMFNTGCAKTTLILSTSDFL